MKIRGTFFTLNLGMTATEIRRISLRRCLMSKFPEILVLLRRKMFSAFYPILHEIFEKSFLYGKPPVAASENG